MDIIKAKRKTNLKSENDHDQSQSKSSGKLSHVDFNKANEN